jgi:arginase
MFSFENLLFALFKKKKKILPDSSLSNSSLPIPIELSNPILSIEQDASLSNIQQEILEENSVNNQTSLVENIEDIQQKEVIKEEEERVEYKKRKFTFILAECNQGQRKNGVELGSKYFYILFKKWILENLTTTIHPKQFYQYPIYGINIVPNVFFNHWENLLIEDEEKESVMEIFSIYSNIPEIYKKIKNKKKYYPIWNHGYRLLFEHLLNNYIHSSTLYEKSIPIIVGGDHSISVGTISAFLYYYKRNSVRSEEEEGKKNQVFWIDAHADLNTYQSSITKNRHGMPVANLMELDEERNWVSNDLEEERIYNIPNLDANEITYFGIRDLDTYEKEIIRDKEIEVYPRHISKTKEQRIFLLNDWLNEWRIRNSTVENIHISFDVDGLDPEYCNSTGTLAEGGLIPEEVGIIIKWCMENRLLRSIDVVEINPVIGDEGLLERTMKQMIEYFFL